MESPKEDDMFRGVAGTLLVILFAMMGLAYAAERGTPEEAKMMVEKAVVYLNEQGKDQALAEFNKPDGLFVKGDLYVFAYNMDGVMVGHPNPKLIGVNLLDKTDSKGKLFRKEINELAKTKGSGWVDYTYLNPVSKQEEPKTTYIQRVDDLIICCGAYKLPAQNQ